jgi:hypothetical protein
VNGIVKAARVLNPILATVVIVLVFVQVYLIADYIFGSASALSHHKTVGGFVVPVELLVFLTALAGWWRERSQVILSLSLLVVGGLQVAFAENIGSSPSVHALHGMLALAVLLLASVIAHRGRRAFGPAPVPTTS